jgi:hypothetical protein
MTIFDFSGIIFQFSFFAFQFAGKSRRGEKSNAPVQFLFSPSGLPESGQK